MRSTSLLVAGFLMACGRGAAPEAPPASAPQAPPPQVATPSTAPAAATPATPPVAVATGEELPEGENIVEEMRAMNSDKYGRPPVKFRRGHVSTRKPPKVVQTRTGFEVKFASGASVVTPSVHRGKVFVSGGFQSKEFHRSEER